ncbi:hypothetical protein EDD30_2017 [Couchioplanes caeruleus]|uniref:Uncharacterized protein n=1 Tax=Couchioplanes caeruleus TaxID=56438 RepID=A0A3N1GGE8_9ACTN|nr:hypothetical protein EDD30_2017 [Couchioplanes caeruleus]
MSYPYASWQPVHPGINESHTGNGPALTPLPPALVSSPLRRLRVARRRSNGRPAATLHFRPRADPSAPTFRADPTRSLRPDPSASPPPHRPLRIAPSASTAPHQCPEHRSAPGPAGRRVRLGSATRPFSALLFCRRGVLLSPVVRTSVRLVRTLFPAGHIRSRRLPAGQVPTTGRRGNGFPDRSAPVRLIGKPRSRRGSRVWRPRSAARKVRAFAGPGLHQAGPSSASPDPRAADDGPAGEVRPGVVWGSFTPGRQPHPAVPSSAATRFDQHVGCDTREEKPW